MPRRRAAAAAARRHVGVVFVIGAIAAGAASLATASCGSEDIGEAPVPAATTRLQKDAGVSSSDDGGVVLVPFDSSTISPEASATATTFKGTLDETLVVKFGGATYCDYGVQLKSITIELAALPDGDIISATVNDTMIETILPDKACPYAPASPSNQVFAFATATKTATGGQTLTFVGDANNHPGTQLTIDLVKSGAAYEAAGTWLRTDIGAPLNWTVKAKLALTSQ